jgi:Ca2+-binding RTX toxin-like protein
MIPFASAAVSTATIAGSTAATASTPWNCLPADNRNLLVDMTVGNVVDGTFGTQEFVSIENITTGGGNDTIIGNAGANILSGGTRAMTASTAGEGDDTIYGGAAATTR